MIGDPAIDYVGFRIAFGSQITSQMVQRSGLDHRQSVTDRIDAYWWIGSVHAVLFGISQGDPSIVDDGLCGLTQRLRALDT